MKALLVCAPAAFAILAGCTSTPAPTISETDAQYAYGYFAGLPQRPSLMK